MTKLEQVARAIAAADGEDYMEDCARYDARAKAAIEAMREPTDAMCEAGDGTPGGPGFCDEPGDPPSAYEIYQDMIDAALTEKE